MKIEGVMNERQFAEEAHAACLEHAENFAPILGKFLEDRDLTIPVAMYACIIMAAATAAQTDLCRDCFLQICADMYDEQEDGQ